MSEKPILMTKEEILKLHELTEEEQYKWLWANIDIEQVVHEGYEDVYESLADLAFRLRDEMHFGDFIRCLRVIAEDSDEPVAWVVLLAAQPIHWIQAALLAKGDE